MLTLASGSRTTTIDLTGFATFALAVITAVYVYLTYKLLLASRSAMAISRQQFRDQTMLALLPHIALEITRRDNGVSLNVSNYGGTEAVDVDVMLIGAYYAPELSVTQFLKQYGRPNLKTEAAGWAPNNDGFYFLYDRLTYGVIPARRRVIAPIVLPGFNGTVYVFIQFRDVAGRNFGRFYWFFPVTGSDRYHLGDVEPHQVREDERIEFPPPASPGPTQLEESGSSRSEFFSGMSRAKSSATIVGGRGPVEDRGEWHDIG